MPLHDVSGEIKKETEFQELTIPFNSEINALGYPKAALFGYSLTEAEKQCVEIPVCQNSEKYAEDGIKHFNDANAFKKIFSSIIEKWYLFSEFTEVHHVNLQKQVILRETVYLKHYLSLLHVYGT